jgi:hypothetical protein
MLFEHVNKKRGLNEMKPSIGGQALWVKIKQQLNNHAERRETI